MARFTRVFGMPELRVRFVRGLRFRLTASYVLFFTLLLAGIGLFYRQILEKELEGREQATLQEQWDAAREYFTIENERPVWNPEPEEAEVVAQLQNMYLIADANGNALGYNPDTYDSIRFDATEIRRIIDQAKQQVLPVRWSKDGEPLLIEAGRVVSDDKRKERYFLAIGRSLADSQRTVSLVSRRYFLLLPLLILVSILLGWLVAGRAIQPLNSVALAAQNITGPNLSLKIPLRGAGDELDHLIESFNLMTARLNQSFEQTRRFSTDVSHAQLRTPP